METKYKHVFFDLDHTLWDFDKNSSEVLCQLYDRHKLVDFGLFSKEDFSNQFRLINNQLWDSYIAKTIDKDYLREARFNLVFKALGVQDMKISQNLATEYLQMCPDMHHVFPFAQEVLHYLQQEKKYVLHIVTNGFEEVQHKKLKSAGLSPYFKEVITADIAGFQKPSREIFQFALQKIAGREEECIMIGDNLEADIKGAKNASIDQVYFNPGKISHKETITYEISCLSELLAIL